MCGTFAMFPFFTSEENGNLYFLQADALQFNSDVLKDLQSGEIDGVAWDRFSPEERDEAMCKLMCKVVENGNRAGRDALMTILRLRGRGVTEEEVETIRSHLRGWAEYQKEWAIDYYYDYRGGDYAPPLPRDADRVLRIERAADYTVGEAIRHVKAMAQMASPAHLENLSTADAADLFAGLLGIKSDPSRIRNEIRTGKIKLTPDGRRTSGAVAQRAVGILEHRKTRVKLSPTSRLQCPQCGEPTHALKGAFKVCQLCFAKAYTTEEPQELQGAGRPQA
jgi:hypothetical protein